MAFYRRHFSCRAPDFFNAIRQLQPFDSNTGQRAAVLTFSMSRRVI
jgi:hypothetical protein